MSNMVREFTYICWSVLVSSGMEKVPSTRETILSLNWDDNSSTILVVISVVFTDLRAVATLGCRAGRGSVLAVVRRHFVPHVHRPPRCGTTGGREDDDVAHQLHTVGVLFQMDDLLH